MVRIYTHATKKYIFLHTHAQFSMIVENIRRIFWEVDEKIVNIYSSILFIYKNLFEISFSLVYIEFTYVHSVEISEISYLKKIYTKEKFLFDIRQAGSTVSCKISYSPQS